jgi:hypothetical protein
VVSLATCATTCETFTAGGGADGADGRRCHAPRRSARRAGNERSGMRKFVEKAGVM